ncbi:phosphoribosylformylglycinamidine cyclo-ligase [Gloeocapsa sp. PCC 73106]|uniref:phosphoribosylformylglycinamidine cyclo-ligase n=1 Tax=Gloeocapsa sp. PCC 73106 TaxID=102232 RepID=UPI0002AC1F2B|nr:phosphoribosylformylglycinamidine cyclo-ligase [Gloeocapsa sp. PCC 73106]ELR98538.1 phosphoribosylformylglycinamidine cyclo-ligase [Gloeocapsa sp. PCC 73106]
MDYQEAGVDILAGRAFVERIRQGVESTYRTGVLGNLGGFGGCFELPQGYQQPVLVSGTDGVGTKLKIAQAVNRHDTIGIDLVGMCVNDVLTCGAEPLFFLDYLATGKLEPEQLAEVVSGIVTGCRLSNCALLGGETAEMPGFYASGEYDLAGFCVGIVEKSKLLNGSQVRVGDKAIALASQGVHSNGFSLVRKIVETRGLDWNHRPDLLRGLTLAESLLTPTQIYVQPILKLLNSGSDIHSMAHITGGGLPENLPRCLNRGQSLRIYPDSWEVPPIFQWLAQTGSVNNEAMFATFNMGIGFVIILPEVEVNSALKLLNTEGVFSFLLGEVIDGNQEVVEIPTLLFV